MSEGGSGGKILIFRKSLPFRFGGEAERSTRLTGHAASLILGYGHMHGTPPITADQ